MGTHIIEHITFKQIFDEEPLLPYEYLKNIEKESLLKTACYIISINTIESYSFECHNFIHVLFQEFLKEKKVNDLLKKLLFIEQSYRKNITFTFIHPRASLDFLKECILLPNTGTSKDTLNDLMNILKAYLALVEIRKTKLQDLLTNITVDNFFEAKLIIAENLQNYALTEYNIEDVQTTQLLKCFAFNNFMKNDYYLKNIQETFLKKYNFSSIYYFIITAMLPLKIYKKPKFKEGIIVLDKKEFCNKHDNLWNYLFFFCNNIAIDVYDLENSKKKLADYKDYTCFKQYPILKINNETFIIISPYFYALKLYDSLRWELKQIYETQKENLHLTQEYSTYITTNFSEHILLYKTLNQLYGGNKYFALSGKNFDDKGIKGRPDYYLRIHNKVFLFEYKDMLIDKNKKDSDNINTFINYLKNRLDQEKTTGKSKQKNKGIPQIINNINDIFLNQFESDRGLKLDSIKIYPILIIDNRIISINGINYILNEWFNEKIQTNTHLKTRQKQIMPLLVIDFDFLTILTFALKNQFGTFITLYHSYQNYLKRNNDIQKYPSFRNYILNNHKISITSNQKAHSVIKSIIK